MCEEVPDVNVDTLDSHIAHGQQCIDEGMGLLCSFRFLWHEYEGWGLHHYTFISMFVHCSVDFRLIERKEVLSLPLQRQSLQPKCEPKELHNNKQLLQQSISSYLFFMSQLRTLFSFRFVFSHLSMTGTCQWLIPVSTCWIFHSIAQKKSFGTN